MVGSQENVVVVEAVKGLFQWFSACSCFLFLFLLTYKLRSQTDFTSICVNTKKFGLNSLRYFASNVWSMVPLEIKNSRSIEIFKTKIRNWEPKDCYCYLCQTYVNNQGFVNVI